MKIAAVPEAQELLDTVFARAGKISVSDHHRNHALRKKASKQVQSIANQLETRLTRIVDSFPSFEDLHPFNRALVDVEFGVDPVRKSLGALGWASEKVSLLGNRYAKRISKSLKRDFIHQSRKEAYGRISSLVKQISSDLTRLIPVRSFLQNMPILDESAPSVVLCGYPNVGKSSLIDALTTAAPKIAAYPFTTTQIYLGIAEWGDLRVQFVDTPGVLLKADGHQPNQAELRALAAIANAASLRLFLFDPSESCGYPLAEQIGLYDKLLANYSGPMLKIWAKADLPAQDLDLSAMEDAIRLSVNEKLSIAELTKIVLEHLAPLPVSTAQ